MSHKHKIIGFYDIPSKDVQSMIDEIYLTGPVVSSIDETSKYFKFYHDGIFDVEDCQKEFGTNALMIVGYNMKNNPNYFILKNKYIFCNLAGENHGEKRGI